VASSAGQIRPGRYLLVFAFIVVLLYLLVFATGDHSATPKLGIDLKGGTTVTLTARTLNGQPPDQNSLNEAQADIQTRVNGLGVTGAQVVRDGTNIVITVPGDQGQEAKQLGQTAKLVFRPVIGTPTPVGATAPPASTAPTTGSVAPSGSAPPSAPATSGAAKPSTSVAPGAPATPTGTPQAAGLPGVQPGVLSPQAYEAAPVSTPPLTPTTAPSAPASSGAAAAPSGSAAPTSGSAAAQPSEQDVAECLGQQPPKTGTGSVLAQTSALIKACRSLRQSTDSTTQQQVLQALQCGPNTYDPLIGNDDPKLPLITCDQQGATKYILGPSFLDGTEVQSPSAQQDPNGAGYIVTLNFTSAGAKTWGTFTAANVGKAAAFVLDTKVVSAPTIQGAITGGNTEISGNFNQQTATSLANTLKYGSLPLAFTASNAETISATLGLASLDAGLIAGGIGLILVVIYCLFYYRALGVLTVLSLALSGLTIYAVLVLLGRWIGYTLDLSGVAGFIISIGITADSFVVFFERLKDEVREGRTFRSAVPRAWVRARRTILASDAVSFLAAVVLYIFAVQDVQGFAFTLGMSTVLDLVIVFLVTHPLVVLASRSKFLSKPSMSGLGAVQKAGAQRRAAQARTAGPKEA
jgi:preprotein translocase subunit SecD